MLRAPFAFSLFSSCALFSAALGVAGCDGSTVDTPEPTTDPGEVGDDDGDTLRATFANVSRMVENPITWDDEVVMSFDRDAGVILKG